MRRCQETAAPFAELRGALPITEPRVSEIVADDGVAERGAWLQERFPWRDRSKVRAWTTLEPRLQKWREEMLDFVGGIREDTAVFTHFIGVNVVAGAAKGVEDTIVFTPDHASITEIEVNQGALQLLSLGASMVVDDVR